MARFVLVAGAWHGAWCWEYVIPLLEERGHRVEAAELPGMGADRTPLDGLDLRAWAGALKDVIDAHAERPILVGHSRGGVVVSQVAELIPERIRLAVYLTALLMRAGETALDINGLVPPETLRPLEVTPTADGLAFLPDRAAIRLAYQDSSHALFERAFARLTPEPRFGLQSALSLSAARYGRVPRAYVECADDQSVPLVLQRAMHAREPCSHVRTLETDHCPQYSAPERVAEALHELVAVA